MKNIKYKLLQTYTITASATTKAFSFKLPQAKNYMLLVNVLQQGDSRVYDFSCTINNRKDVRAKKTPFIQRQTLVGGFPYSASISLLIDTLRKNAPNGLQLPLHAKANTLIKGVLNAPAVSGISGDTVQVILKTWD